MQNLVHVKESIGERIINLSDVSSAGKSLDETVWIYMIGNGKPLIFQGEAAKNVWRVLNDASVTIYDFTFSEDNAKPN